MKKLFCMHKKNSKVVCWHWTHGINAIEVRYLEICLKCNDCDRFYFRTISDWHEANKFTDMHKGKEWIGYGDPRDMYYNV